MRLDQKGEGKVTHAIRIDGVDARSRVGKVGLGDVVRRRTDVIRTPIVNTGRGVPSVVVSWRLVRTEDEARGRPNSSSRVLVPTQ